MSADPSASIGCASTPQDDTGCCQKCGVNWTEHWEPDGVRYRDATAPANDKPSPGPWQWDWTEHGDLRDADGRAVLMEVGCMRSADAALIAAAPETKRELDEAVALLRPLEWSYIARHGAGPDEPNCPVCHFPKRVGHSLAGCRLAELLANIDAKGPKP